MVQVGQCGEPEPEACPGWKIFPIPIVRYLGRQPKDKHGRMRVGVRVGVGVGVGGSCGFKAQSSNGC